MCDKERNTASSNYLEIAAALHYNVCDDSTLVTIQLLVSGQFVQRYAGAIDRVRNDFFIRVHLDLFQGEYRTYLAAAVNCGMLCA